MMDQECQNQHSKPTQTAIMNKRVTPAQQPSNSKGEDEEILKLIVQLNELALHCKDKHLSRLALEHAAHYLSCWMGNVKDFVDKDTILTQLFDMIKPSKITGRNDDNKEEKQEEEDGARKVKEGKEVVVTDDAKGEEDKKNNKEEEEVTKEDGKEEEEKGDRREQRKEEEEEQSSSSLNLLGNNDQELLMGLLHPPSMISLMGPSPMESNKEDSDKSVAKSNNKLWMVNVLGCVIVHNLGVACWPSQLQQQEQKEEENDADKDLHQVMELFQTCHYMSQEVVNHRIDENDVRFSCWANAMAHQVTASSNLIMKQKRTNHPPYSVKKKRRQASSPNDSTKPAKQQRTMTSSAA